MSEDSATGGNDPAASNDEPEASKAPLDTQKSYATILEQEIREGIDELERPARGLFLSGVSAGLDVGFSVLAIGVVGTLVDTEASELTRALLRANAYALGFIFVIFGRSELFTEHTTLAVLPMLDGRTSVGDLARLWGLVYVGNLVGVTIFSALLALASSGLGSFDPRIVGELVAHVLDLQAWQMLLSAVLAGWLMGLVSWLVTAGRDTTSQLLFVWIVTGLIGLTGLHHCILGSAEVLTALFSGAPLTLLDFARFLAIATIGNALGGFFFVAIIKYGHASVIRTGLRDPHDWRRPE